MRLVWLLLAVFAAGVICIGSAELDETVGGQQSAVGRNVPHQYTRVKQPGTVCSCVQSHLAMRHMVVQRPKVVSPNHCTCMLGLPQTEMGCCADLQKSSG